MNLWLDALYALSFLSLAALAGFSIKRLKQLNASPSKLAARQWWGLQEQISWLAILASACLLVLSALAVVLGYMAFWVPLTALPALGLWLSNARLARNRLAQSST